jgi:hypothetical protein
VSDRVYFNTVFQEEFVTANFSAPIVFGWVILNLKWFRLDSIFYFFRVYSFNLI